MTQVPAFSIVTITWNNLAGLRATSASVAEQSFRDFEWIVIDGASSDGTPELATSEFSHANTFVSEPDKGLYDAMNKGLALAQGRYVIFMNGGDTFADPAVLADIAGLSEFGTAHLIYGDAYEVDGDYAVYKEAFSPKLVTYTMFAHHQSMFYRREALGELEYELDYRIAADWVLTARLLRKGGPVKHVARAICRFERDGLSQSASPKVIRQMREERRRALREVHGLKPLHIHALIGVKSAVEAVRRKFPALYDRLRMRSN